MFNIEIYLDSLPEDIEEIDVSNKGIKSLDVTRFKNLKILHCEYNQLTYLHLNENLQYLSCHNNRLTSLHLNENLKILWCCNNHLISLHLNDNLRTLYYADNPIYEITKHRDEDIIKQKIQILNNFRYLYYCLKFKTRLRDL